MPYKRNDQVRAHLLARVSAEIFNRVHTGVVYLFDGGVFK